MRGQENQNFRVFFVAEALLEMKGHQVVNPARLDIEQGTAEWSAHDGRLNVLRSFTIQDALRRDIVEMALHCEAIALLAGWEDSEGANKELHFARTIGLQVFTYNSETEDIESLPEPINAS